MRRKITKAEQNAWKTAIGRTEYSAPCRYLIRHDFIDLINDRVLDFGCGRGFDAINGMMEKYDPHFFPKMPEGKFDVVMCNYVINVLPKSCEATVLKQIFDKLKKGGNAYITVRRNLKKEGYTATGTYQRIVYLDFPKVFEDNDFCIYAKTKL